MLGRPGKRKREESLAEQVLQDKLDLLKTRNIHLPEPASDSPAFDYLLSVCRAVEPFRQKETPTPLSKDTRDAERRGDYDYQALQSESIHQSIAHKAYLGPITTGPLPPPKCQGVITTEKVLKGQLLCTSVPSITVQNLAAVDDPSEMIFSDLSRAEMTALLIAQVEDREDLREALRKYEYAGKEKDLTLVEQCTSVIAKYTWAIDHPYRTKGTRVKDKETKVAGHAFSLQGYAGKFNHSCVPNATMVTYGAIQFFFANVTIDKGVEVCVSYGFDANDTVQERRRKLHQHAGFDCDCPLCRYQLERNPVKVPEQRNLVHQLWGLVSAPTKLSLRSAKATIKELSDLVDLMEGSMIVPDASLLHILELQPKVAALAEARLKRPGGPSILAFKTQIILLHLMLLGLEVKRDPEVGIPFGDQFRGELQCLGRLLDAEQVQDYVKAYTEFEFIHSEFWYAKSMLFTDNF